MGRRREPEARFRVGKHVIGDRVYASTQSPIDDPVTGKRTYRHHHWGTLVDGVKFKPGKNYALAPPELRGRLVFPEGWDLSEAKHFNGPVGAERASHAGEGGNSLYGDVWLLERIAEATGLRQDLETVFEGDRGLVDDILTLAMFPYLTRCDYNQVAGWQSYAKTPSSRKLSPSAVTQIVQAITADDRVRLLGLRAARLGQEELCSVGSTSGSAVGLADPRHGKNQEDLPLEQTMETVVYSLSSHIPIYYRQFPGNMTDSRSLETMMEDLKESGFKDLIFITDLGYETTKIFEKYILEGQKLITAAKTSSLDIYNTIKEMGEISGRPSLMEYDQETKLYFKQYKDDIKVKNLMGSMKVSDRMILNLYFDGYQRVSDLYNLDEAIMEQRRSLDDFIETEKSINIEKKRDDFPYFKVITDPISNIIEAFSENTNKIQKASAQAGFFAIKMYKINLSAMDAYYLYQLRDEQENFFTMMKTQMLAGRQRNWSGFRKEGHLFIIFIGLTLVSYLRHIWKTTILKNIFPTAYDIILEMRSIRCIEQPGQAKVITPFVGRQVDVCQAFGIEIPEGGAPIRPSRQAPEGRRGRPPKRPVEVDSW